MALTSAFDLLAEARWEHEGVRRAQVRYREAAAAADPATLPSGQKLLRAVVPPLTAGVVALQLQALETLGVRGRPPLWALPVQLLPAEVLALITLCRALAGSQVPSDQAASLAVLTLDVATAVKDEVDFRTWVAGQIAANKAAKADRDLDHHDALAGFRRRYPSPDRRAWKDFCRRMQVARTEPWDKQTAAHLGAALIKALTDAAPQHFEVALRRIDKGRTQNYLRLSEEALAVVRDVEERAAVARPQLMPMIIPPLPWRYE